MTPLEFGNTLKGKVKYRFMRALFTRPTKRPFSIDNPFLTSFDTHKTMEGNTYWYEITKCYLAGEPLITMKMHPEFKYKDAPKESTLFVTIKENGDKFDLMPLAFVDMGLEGELPSFNEPLKSSLSKKQLHRFKSNLYLVEYV